MERTTTSRAARRLVPVLALAAALLAAACSSGDAGGAGASGPTPGSAPAGPVDPSAWPDTPPPQGSRDRPWEITSDLGESYLPNLFYADASETEQIMPLTIDGRYPIDRLVYPTLGNPNLYVKGDPKDSLMVVLRLEPDLYQPLRWSTRPVEGSPLQELFFEPAAENDFVVYLVAKSARPQATEPETPVRAANGKDVVRIKPSKILVHPVPDDMPAAFKRRATWRVIFDQAAMKDVPPGLYDVRYEIKRNGGLAPGGGYEFQYNAVRVFDRQPANDEYSIINVTDTQVSLGATLEDKTLAKLKDFVSMVNLSTDPNVRKAAFITFNGDLHQGGSVGGLRSDFVANTYAREGREILLALKELAVPMFLTIGNHDGYVSTGQVPTFINAFEASFGSPFQEVVAMANPKAWPDFDWSRYQGWLAATQSWLGGWHRDVFTGGFVRRTGATTFKDGFIPLERKDRNYILYDGFYQWQRTFGPLYASWTFGKNHFVNMNSFDLRQHRRSGWGMYTVNYGGGVSPTQMEWIARELDRAESLNRDVVVLAHHDPRGGHKNKDYPYLFEQLEYHGIGQSAWNYVAGKYVFPFLCDKLPAWAQTDVLQNDCLHDGLQEWMRPDEEMDCDDADRLPNGTCNTTLFDPKLDAQKRHYPRFSGLELIDQLLEHPRVRTILLGHTHYHALEVFQSGDELLPGKMAPDQMKAYASMEVQNPLRGFAWSTQPSSADFDPQGLQSWSVDQRNARAAVHFEEMAKRHTRVVQGAKRELLILRSTSNAEMNHQKYAGRTMIGFSILHLEKKNDARAYDAPQINRVTMYINAGAGAFDLVKDVPLDRTARVRMDDPTNPVNRLFQ
jgi:hypothetical protein